jgi:hypothetical protein
MKKLLVGIVLGVMLVSAGIAVASIPDSSGVIHGCYLTSGNPNIRGALRVIDTEAGQTCSSSETAIEWNQEGPQGPTGAQGPTGYFSTANLQVRSYSVPTDPSGYTSLFIDCLPGEVPISGGFEFPGANFDPEVDGIVAAHLVPFPSEGNPVRYRVIARTQVANSITIFVLCASP